MMMSSYHLIIISSYHLMMKSSYHLIITSSYHLIIISSYHQIMSEQPKFPKKSTRHFSKNLDKRPGICANHNQIRLNLGTISRIRQKVAWEFQTSNGSKIARLAPILTIFGRNRSRRPDLVFQKFSRRRKYFHSPQRLVSADPPAPPPPRPP